MARINYCLGEEIGNLGCQYIEESLPKGYKRYAYFSCGECDEGIFIARIDQVKNNKSFRCKQCLDKKKKQQWKEFQQKGTAISSQNRTQYHEGDIIHGMILFEKELDSVIESNHKRRYGIFKNIKTNIRFKTTLSSVLNKNTLGLGPRSYGEQVITNFLNQKNILFYSEYSFIDCYSEKSKPLRFDFYLPEYNCCIEYDGIQHYKNTFQMSEEKYQEYLKNDKIKTNYCDNHGISLLRIPYYEKNIIKQLELFLENRLVPNGQ